LTKIKKIIISNIRWFVLNPESGHLDYFLIEENNLGHPVIGKLRSTQTLAGTIVIPSEDDSQVGYYLIFILGAILSDRKFKSDF